MSVSRYVVKASSYQSRSLMYIRGLIPLNSMGLAEAVPIEDFGAFRIYTNAQIYAHADVSSEARGLNLSLIFHLQSYFVYASSKGFGKSGRMLTRLSLRCSLMQ